MLRLEGFPLLAEQNELRRELYTGSHTETSPPTVKTEATRLSMWVAHKGLSVTLLPLNLAGSMLGLSATLATACTLGAVKVAIFAASLGHIKPTFPSGFYWFAERTIHAIIQFNETLYELAADVVGVFQFVIERFIKGIEKTLEGEAKPPRLLETPKALRTIDDVAKETRIDFFGDERPWDFIAAHYISSVANVPLNALAAVATFAGAIASLPIITTKVIVYATTNINIPIPTYVSRTVHIYTTCMANVVADLASDFGDTFIMLYKVIDGLGLKRALVRCGEIIRYIPVAVFS